MQRVGGEGAELRFEVVGMVVRAIKRRELLAQCGSQQRLGWTGGPWSPGEIIIKSELQHFGVWCVRRWNNVLINPILTNLSHQTVQDFGGNLARVSSRLKISTFQKCVSNFENQPCPTCPQPSCPLSRGPWHRLPCPCCCPTSPTCPQGHLSDESLVLGLLFGSRKRWHVPGL